MAVDAMFLLNHAVNTASFFAAALPSAFAPMALFSHCQQEIYYP